MNNYPGRWHTLSYSIHLQLVKQLHFSSHKCSQVTSTFVLCLGEAILWAQIAIYLLETNAISYSNDVGLTFLCHCSIKKVHSLRGFSLSV